MAGPAVPAPLAYRVHDVPLAPDRDSGRMEGGDRLRRVWAYWPKIKQH